MAYRWLKRFCSRRPFEHLTERSQFVIGGAMNQAEAAAVPSAIAAVTGAASMAFGRQLEKPDAMPITDLPYRLDPIQVADLRHGLGPAVNRLFVDALDDVERLKLPHGKDSQTRDATLSRLKDFPDQLRPNGAIWAPSHACFSNALRTNWNAPPDESFRIKCLT